MKKPRVRTIDEIVALVSLSYGSNSKEVELVKKAYEYANSRFEAINKKRNSGEPYMNHCTRVAWALASTGKCAETVAAGLLHDTPEDIEECTIEDIEKEFGEVVARRVEAVTKDPTPNIKGKNTLSPEEYSNLKKQAKDNTLIKLIAFAVDDPDVIDIKIQDRLDNMRDLDFKEDSHTTSSNKEEKAKIDRAKRYEIAMETLEIYAPLADLRGAGRVRTELEDLALMQLDRKSYKRLKTQIDNRRTKLDPELIDVFKRLQRLIIEENMVSEMVDKTRHVYVAYQHEQNNISPSEMEDLITIKVMLSSLKDCYRIAWLISKNFPEDKKQRKDTIQVPEMNGYQSLHMTIYGKDGNPFQIQLKTFQMDLIASFGSRKKSIEELRELAEKNKDSQDISDIASKARHILLRGEVIAKTIGNDPIILERNATLVDFAAAVHTELLFSMTGGKVNGQTVPIETKLESGDTVEIMTRGQFTINKGLPGSPLVSSQKDSIYITELVELKEKAGTSKVKALISKEIGKRSK